MAITAMEATTQNGTPPTTPKQPRYKGAYNKLFPVKVSMNTMISIYVLHMLTEKESLYGKEIIDQIEERFAGQWKPSHGLVYPILRELEEASLVKGHWVGKNSKKTIRKYSITAKGRKAYSAEKEKHKGVFEQSYHVMETLMGDLYDDHKLIDWE